MQFKREFNTVLEGNADFVPVSELLADKFHAVLFSFFFFSPFNILGGEREEYGISGYCFPGPLVLVSAFQDGNFNFNFNFFIIIYDLIIQILSSQYIIL
jgi:hypothetical protein